MKTSDGTPHWHPVLVKALAQCLKETFIDGYYADKVLERAFKLNRKWGGRDRKFLAETLYDMTRWWSRLAFLDRQPLRCENFNQFVCRWVYYEGWKHKISALEFVKKSFPETFELIKNIDILKDCDRLPQNPWEELAYPEWLFEKFKLIFRADTLTVLGGLNAPAPVCLRANTLKTNPEKLVDLLLKQGVSATHTDKNSDALILTERKNVFATQAFKDGLFEVQDGASQKVAALLKPLPGERIADVCAGAGGKTLHLAALMKNKGSILACDVSDRKLEQLKIRARRAGVSNLRIQLLEGTKTIKRNADNFDGVLIDAPCSGTGVLRRNADTKWKLSPEELVDLGKLQQEILENYSKLVKKGGRLVYATCSLLIEENELQIDQFLKNHPEFRLDGEALKTRPDLTGEDGFFAQRLLKA